MSLLRKLTTLLRRPRFEAELDEELRFHLEMEANKLQASGATAAQVRTQALRDFGGVERFKDEVRDQRGLTLVDDVLRDVRFGFRTLKKNPGFTAIAVLCLALGIGANAAIFSVVNAVLLRPLPLASPERLVQLYETQPARGADWTGSVSWPNFVEWREQARSFSHLVAYESSGMT
jgi:putative ABC transport system permease protein